ncbi:PA14 domain protein [Botrimarina colliarenosi]|uniref:PA14 domain protein n=1 Tax=Botrimarina colliarenosi TaxID=2528001 RepID=A0A5C6AFU7_9BACT|nr:DUF1592 domain-containing protein [Botrimarina colliarenosi]TWT97931.1 PA14 domain protein [Botrimarina colliarenosi]
MPASLFQASRSAKWLIALLVAQATLATPLWAVDGAAVYSQKCADCHGPTGQGGDDYSKPLAGDLPVSELTRVIASTMPEGDPEACIAAEAEAVAAYAHATFYSPLAQARVRPPRRELSRLTVRQYEQSLADLFAEFRSRPAWGDDSGLRCVFEAKFNVTPVADPIELVAPQIDLKLSDRDDFPDRYLDPAVLKSSGKERIDVHLHVHGGVIAPTTGDYEFLIRSRNSVQLSINGVAVIDARVRSDSDDEVRGKLRLIGGRAYRLELRTARTREDDLQIALLWKRPDGVLEVLARRFLTPGWFPVSHATTAKFPPDDRSVGYVRGANVSAAWDEATTNAALEAAQAVIADLPALAKAPGEEPRPSIDAIPRDAAIGFCKRFAEAAFRRPLDDDEVGRYVGRFFEPLATGVAPVVVEGVELSLLSILKSPLFLYPEAALLSLPLEPRRDYGVSTRLALGLWDSAPDRQLRKRAGQGGLAEPAAARAQAERMLGDPRTRSKLAEFFEHWLRLQNAAQLSRDPTLFPDFNSRIAADMRASLEMLLDDVVWSADGDLRTLFLSEELYANRRLADFLGVAHASDDPEAFVRAPVDTRERAGVVSHPYIVTAFSYYRDTSPIHRGVFLARHVLGRSLRPPPEAVAPLAPELAPDMTTRERVTTQTSPGACQACHVLINDLGFTLEHFDAVGRYRREEIGRPIDASGGYIATDGGTVRLSGARDLANFLATSEDVHRSFVTQLFEHVTKQPALAYGVETRERLLRDFQANGFNIRDLLVDIAVTAAVAE